MGRMRVSLAFNIFLVIFEVLACCLMMVGYHSIGLSAPGLHSLRYFTVLSNILLGIASLVFAVHLVGCLRTGKPVSRGMLTFKFIATVAVMVTFTVVMAFLGPVFGFDIMFKGANFWFHLTLPLVSLVEFCFVDRFGRIGFSRTFVAVLPVLAYGIAYYVNIFVNGVGTWPDTNDWYGFTSWGLAFSGVIFAAIAVVTWLLGVIVRGINVAGQPKAARHATGKHSA